MNALLKNPVWLVGAVAIGLLIFAGRSGGGGSGKLQAAIASQDIASRANVAMADIQARRDIGMAQAASERAAIAAGYQINFVEQMNAGRAVSFAHSEAMRNAAVMARLGELEITTARDVAYRSMGTQLALADIGAGVEHARLAVANEMNLRGVTLGHAELTVAHDIATRPNVLEHVQMLAGIDVEKQKALASIAGSNAQALAAISQQTALLMADKQAGAVSGAKKDDLTGDLIRTGVSALASWAFSDRRLKRELRRVGATRAGVPVYVFRYLWDALPRVGVMAQDVLAVAPWAVRRAANGFLMVDYSRVP